MSIHEQVAHRRRSNELFRVGRFQRLLQRPEVTTVEVLKGGGWKIRRDHWAEGDYLEYWPAQCVYFRPDGRTGVMGWKRLLKRLKLPEVTP